MKHLLFTLLAAVAFVACSSDDDAPKSISLTDGTSKTQTVYADQTSAGDGIHFKADAEWYAQVDEVQTKAGGSNVAWIELSRYNGSAGEYTLTLTIEPNTSGNDRSAKIVIVCGTDRITILVEQRSTTESGDLPAEKKLVDRIIFSDLPADSYGYIHTHTFKYDNQNRIVEYSEISRSTDTTYPSERCMTAYRFDYTIVGEIRMSEFDPVGYEGHIGDDVYTVALNKSGYATSTISTDSRHTYSYNSDQTLAGVVGIYPDYNSDNYDYTFRYTGGALTGYIYSGRYKTDSTNVAYTVDELYAHKYPNPTNINLDINALVRSSLDEEPNATLSLMRLLGVPSKYLIDTYYYDEDNYGYAELPFDTPNVVVDRVYTYYDYAEKAAYDYRFDNEGYVTDIILLRPYTKTVETVRYTVGSEPEDFKRGYKYTQEVIKTTKTTGEDRISWEITYK